MRCCEFFVIPAIFFGKVMTTKEQGMGPYITVWLWLRLLFTTEKEDMGGGGNKPTTKISVKVFQS